VIVGASFSGLETPKIQEVGSSGEYQVDNLQKNRIIMQTEHDKVT